MIAFQGVWTLWHTLDSAKFLHSTLNWLWPHVWENQQVGDPCSWRRMSTWLSWNLSVWLWMFLAGEDSFSSTVGSAVYSQVPNGDTTYSPPWHYGTLDIRGHQVALDDMCDWVKMWFCWQPTSFFKDGIDCLISLWDKCINSFRDYFWGKKCSITLLGIWPVFIWLPFIVANNTPIPTCMYGRWPYMY